jgi:methionyl-tRNA formyltransferase
MIRVVFFGMTGNFSIPPLEKLIAAGIDICAIVVPAATLKADLEPRRLEPPPPSPSELPIINPHLDRSILHRAWENHILVWEVNSLQEARTLEMLADLEPDLIIVACFPYLFPPALLQLPRHGSLNLHPSLLPAFRGPTPLFWIARQDERRAAGVTLHFLDEGLDTGDIVAQMPLTWPDEMAGTEFEQRCAVAGGRLVVAAVQQLAQTGKLSGQPQTAAEEASYFPKPAEQDLVIPINWSAHRAFKFVRGADNWPLAAEVGDQHFRIRVVIDYTTNQLLNQPYILDDNELQIQLNPGTLRVQI